MNIVRWAIRLGVLALTTAFLSQPAVAREAGERQTFVFCAGILNEEPVKTDIFLIDFDDLAAAVHGPVYEAFRARDDIAGWFKQIPGLRSGDCDFSSFSENLGHNQEGWKRIDWSPPVGTRLGDALSVSSAKKTISIPFRSPHKDERGYSAVTFDVEYQFIVCSGELHIAYSIVEDSVRKAHNDPFSDLYLMGGKRYEVSTPPKTILNLPLKGRVFPTFNHADIIGTFADDNAGKALGFGCFSGQSQKIADLKDVVDEAGNQLTAMSKEYLSTFLSDRLDVTFETTQVLTSAEAEDEIRAGISKDVAAKNEQADKSAEEGPQADQSPSEAELRAQRRTQEEAEFQAKQKAYEDGMAEHQAAVEQYQKALADAEAQKAANAAAAKAQQDEFARKQAEYEAEAAKAKQAQDEYEAKYGKPQ